MKLYKSGNSLFSLMSYLFVILALTIMSSQAGYAQVTTSNQLRLLVCTGMGEVNVRPDLVEVRLGVDTEAPTAAAARQQNATRAGKVIDALRALGIPEKDIQTSTFQIQPVRRYPNNEPQMGEPPIVAYRVSNIVTVRTAQMDLAPRIIDDSVKAGANRVDDINFILKDQTAASQEALRKAIANARMNAETMAKELGVKLVRVQLVQQGGAGVIPPPILYRGEAMAAASMAPTPVLPGEVTVNASATLTYVID